MYAALQPIAETIQEQILHDGRTEQALSAGFVAERIIAAMLLLAASPVLLFLLLLHRSLEKRHVPFLYHGTRIGKEGQPFTIFKIRTLVPDAEGQLGGRLHGSDSALELRMGPFLRKTRLDELPQLWNIVRGDMAFVGPRPERPSVYEAQCRSIRGYHERFQVRPGLTGISQFLTPHGAPKALRARVDRIMMGKMNTPFWGTMIVLWTAYAVLRNVVTELARPPLRALRRLLGLRYRTVQATLETPGTGTEDAARLEVFDLEPDNICVRTCRVLPETADMHVLIARRREGRMRTARCQAASVRRLRNRRLQFTSSPYVYEISYRPLSARHEYTLSRHVLRQTVA